MCLPILSRVNVCMLYCATYYAHRQDKQLQYASVLCLHVLRSALPFIKPLRPSSSSSSSSSTDPLAVPSAILSHLCGLLDSTAEPDHVVQRLAQEIVVEGVVLFFPDAKARKDYLLKMIDSVLVRSLGRGSVIHIHAVHMCTYMYCRLTISIQFHEGC